MNEEHYKHVLDKIKKNPKTWNQLHWHCKTTHCFFGHAQIEAGKAPNDDTVRRDAREYLELTAAEATWLASPKRTLADFESFLAEGWYRDGYNRDGYDRAGYNRYGYNRYGYDRDGYDIDGLDRNFKPRKAEA